MFGRTLLTTSTIQPTRVSADNSPAYKAGGITIDWSTVVALTNDAALADGSTVKAPNKYLRYGQIMTKITAGEADTVTIGGGATGGTFTLTVQAAGGGALATTSALAFAASAATVQAALVLLTTVGTGNAVVSGSNGGPWTVTFAGSLGAVVLTGSPASLLGGTPTLVVAATSDSTGTNFNYFGPYDPAATDGRQTLTRGECFILDETLLQYNTESSALSTANDQTGRVLDGGLVWLDRVLQSGIATHTLAVGPTKAEFLAAFPTVRLVEN